MPDTFASTPTPPPLAVQPVATQTSGKCVASLVLGILGLVPFPCTSLPMGVLALVLGILGLRQTRQRPAELTGGGMAIAGIVMGGLVILMIPLMVAIAVPGFIKAREKAQANFCMESQSKMDAAVDTWAMDQAKKAADLPTAADLIGPHLYLRIPPVCPAGSDGATLLAVPQVGASASCPNGIPGHARPE